MKSKSSNSFSVYLCFLFAFLFSASSFAQNSGTCRFESGGSSHEFPCIDRGGDAGAGDNARIVFTDGQGNQRIIEIPSIMHASLFDAGTPDSGITPDAGVGDAGSPPDGGTSGGGVTPSDSFSVDTIGYGDGGTSVRWNGIGSILYIAEKRGLLYAAPSGDTSNIRTVLDLSSVVQWGGERGLLGLAVDPTDDTVLYIGFTTTGGDYRVEALQLSLDGMSVLGRSTVISGLANTADHHKGGGLAFRPSGEPNNLYIALGDDGHPSEASNIDRFAGKVLRVNKLTGEGVPSNPWYRASNPRSIRSRVYSRGHRNPWRITFCRDVSGFDCDPSAVYVTENGDATDKFSRVEAGSDGRWSTAGDGGGFLVSSPGHNVLVTRFAQSGQVMLDTVVLGGTAFSTSRGDVVAINGSWLNDTLYRFRLDDVGGANTTATSVGSPPGSPTFATGFAAADIEYNPADGCLYGIQAGVDQATGGFYTRSRLCPDLGAPLAAFGMNTTDGNAPLTVRFTDASNDPDGMVTGWAWDFDGNSSVDSTRANPTHVYSTPGIYDVGLTVTDNDQPANSGTASGRIIVRDPNQGYACADLSGIPETPNVDFANDVHPIFSSCTGCHSGTGSTNGGLNLNGSAETVRNRLVRISSVNVPGVNRVEPGDPDRSYLLEAMGCDIPRGNEMRRMHSGPDAELALVRDWIRQLAGNADAGVPDSGGPSDGGWNPDGGSSPDGGVVDAGRPDAGTPSGPVNKPASPTLDPSALAAGALGFAHEFVGPAGAGIPSRVVPEVDPGVADHLRMSGSPEFDSAVAPHQSLARLVSYFYPAGSGWNEHACSGGAPDGFAYELIMRLDESSWPNSAVMMWAVTPDSHLYWQFRNGGLRFGSGPSTIVDINNPPSVRELHHYIINVDRLAGVLEVWIDGQLAGTDTFSSMPTSSYCFANFNENRRALSLASFRYYSAPLSAAQIDEQFRDPYRIVSGP